MKDAQRSGTCFVVNPVAGSCPDDALLERLVGPDDRLDHTRAPGDAGELALAARDDGFARVVAVGGDGTVSEVVDALAPEPDGVVLGILPAGTGNDLARTLSLPVDPEEAAAVLQQGAVRPIDLIRMEPAEGEVRHGINASVGGVASRATDELDQDTKRFWGVLAFLASGAKALGEIEEFDVRLDAGDALQEACPAVGMVVANGRTCGGGWRCAPHASLEDGLLDLILVRAGDPLDYARAAANLLGGAFDESPLVQLQPVRHLEVHSEPPMHFNIDGELAASTPVRFAVVPGALKVVVGPDYVELPVP